VEPTEDNAQIDPIAEQADARREIFDAELDIDIRQMVREMKTEQTAFSDLDLLSFGSTGSGFSCGEINSRAPIKNWALICNKQGVGWIENVTYKLPPGVQNYFYCSPQDSVCPMEYIKDQVPRYIADAVIFESKCSKSHGNFVIPGTAASREFHDQFLWKYM